MTTDAPNPIASHDAALTERCRSAPPAETSDVSGHLLVTPNDVVEATAAASVGIAGAVTTGSILTGAAMGVAYILGYESRPKTAPGT